MKLIRKQDKKNLLLEESLWAEKAMVYLGFSILILYVITVIYFTI